MSKTLTAPTRRYGPGELRPIIGTAVNHNYTTKTIILHGKEVTVKVYETYTEMLKRTRGEPNHTPEADRE